jgi:hypothetical protein
MPTAEQAVFSSRLMAPIVPVMGEITNAKGELDDDNLTNAVPFWASSCDLALIDCFLWTEDLKGSAKICIDKESTLGDTGTHTLTRALPQQETEYSPILKQSMNCSPRAALLGPPVVVCAAPLTAIRTVAATGEPGEHASTSSAPPIQAFTNF